MFMIGVSLPAGRVAAPIPRDAEDDGNGNLDQCLTRTRHRIGALDIFQRLAAAGAVHHDGFIDLSLS
jgi:hypothetical protein